MSSAFINHLWNSSCGSDFMCSKKVRSISRFDWDRQSRMCDYHSSLHALGKLKTNRLCASQICIGIIIVLSIKTQSLCDVLIGRELDELTPTANDDWTFYEKPWGIGLAAIFWSFVAEAKFGLPLSSSGVLRCLKRVSRKKIGVN